MPDGYHIFEDGDMWCAVGPYFTNLQECPAGFDFHPVLAFMALLAEEAIYV